MAKTTKGALDALKSHLQRCAYLNRVEFGRPVEPPEDWDTFIVLVRFEPNPGEESTVDGGTIERRVVSIRIYTRVLAEPRPDWELKRDEVAVKLHEDILGGYTLGGTVRWAGFPTVDFIGDEVKGKEYDVIQMAYGFIVDDSATLAP